MIEIRTVTNLQEAEILWRALSPNEKIFDEWDFRYCFYKHKPYPLYFLAAYEKEDLAREIGGDRPQDNERLVGLLPLEHNPLWNCFDFFAEEHSEESRPFIRPGYDQIIPRLYAAIAGPVQCDDISGDDEFTRALPIEDYIYFLPLAGLRTWDDYLSARLSAKKQRNLRHDIRRIEELKPRVFYGRPSDVDAVFTINSSQFSDSYLHDKVDRDSWRDLLSLNFAWEIIGIEINGVTQAASLSVLYNNIYIYLINGANKRDFPGLGKYLNKINLERAMELGAQSWDAGLGDCSWKKAWHLDTIPQYYFHQGVSED